MNIFNNNLTSYFYWHNLCFINCKEFVQFWRSIVKFLQFVIHPSSFNKACTQHGTSWSKCTLQKFFFFQTEIQMNKLFLLYINLIFISNKIAITFCWKPFALSFTSPVNRCDSSVYSTNWATFGLRDNISLKDYH